MLDIFSQAFSILPEPHKGPFWNTLEDSSYSGVWFVCHWGWMFLATDSGSAFFAKDICNAALEFDQKRHLKRHRNPE